MQKAITIERRESNLGLFCFLGLNIADCAITWWALSMGGIELNWYKYVLGTMPVWGMLSVKMALVGLVAFLVYKYKRKLFKPLDIGMGLIVAFNLSMILRVL